MQAKFLDDNKRHLKRIRTDSNFIDLTQFHFKIYQMLAIFRVESERTVSQLRNRNFSAAFKRAREIRKFHVAVVQRRLRNVQKSVMHVHVLHCRSRCRRRRRCLSFILLWSRHFANMVTWRHTCPLYWLETESKQTCFISCSRILATITKLVESLQQGLGTTTNWPIIPVSNRADRSTTCGPYFTCKQNNHGSK